MRAISLWQPWASLIACGAKRHETRSRAARTGPLAIAATATIRPEVRALFHRDPEFHRVIEAALGTPDDWPVGVVVATCVIESVERTEDLVASGQLEDLDRLLGDYRPGRFAWVLTNIHRIDPPIRAKGKQGFWEWRVDRSAPRKPPAQPMLF